MIDMVAVKFETSVFLLLFICSVCVITGTKVSRCPAEFEERCECGNVLYEREISYVTNCTNTGFDNAMMLRELPPETEVLIFVGNKVRDLPPNIFSTDTTYDELHTIDLSNNIIQSIKGKTFHKVENVRKLVLNNNDLYIVSKDHHPRMFSNFMLLEELHLRNAFTKKLKSEDYLNNLADIFQDSTLKYLKILDMGDNGISQLSYNEFCSLPSLEELYLADNHLTDISINFTCLPKLRKLDLSNNNISSLSRQMLLSFQNVSHLSLSLSDNPFKCDCDILDTYNWMLETTTDLVNREAFRCSDHFAGNKGKYLLSVPKEEFRCINTNVDDSGTTITHHIILAFGIIILIVVVVLLLHKNKQQVSVFMGRFIQPIRNKFQYVSLERREDTLDV